MVGVTRIHRAQQDALYSDALSCDAMIKRAIAQSSWDVQAEALLTVRGDQIDIVPIPIDFDFDTLDPQNIVFKVPRFGEHVSQDPDASYDINASQFDIIVPQLDDRSERERRSRAHLLDEKHLFDLSFSNSGPSDDPYVEEINEPLFGDGEEIDLGVDFGQPADVFGREDDLMNDAAGWGNQEQDRAGDNEVRGASETANVRTDKGKGIFSDGVESRSHKPPSSIGAPATPLRPANTTEDFPFNEDFQLEDPFQDNAPMNIDDDVHLDAAHVEDIPLPAPKKPRSTAGKSGKRKHAEVTWDERTELTAEELKEMGQGYEERMHKQRREVERKERKDQAAKLAFERQYVPPIEIFDPQLNKRWADMMKIHFDNGKAQNDKDGFAVPALPRRKAARRMSLTIDEADAMNPQVAFGGDDIQPFGGDEGTFFDDGGMNQDYNMTVNFGDDGDIPFDDNVGQRGSSVDQAEQGRKGSSKPSSLIGSQLGSAVKGSHRSSIAPWDPSAAMDEEPNIADAFDTYGFPSSSIKGSATKRQDRIPSNPISPLSNRNRMSLAQPLGEDVTMDADETQQTDVSLATMEKQSLLFFNHLSTRVNPLTKSITFDKLLEPRKTTRAVAASGFYHLLGIMHYLVLMDVLMTLFPS
ncbi:hypothetical protein FRC02_008632 [Tulasnella sp. 418]|nr:hypothetical protein FRC02_008632 [Tulasnella sp. 418]